VTTTKIDVKTKEARDRLREELAQQIKEYLAKGGKVTQCPDRTFTQTEGYAKKFAGSQFDSLTDPSNRDVGAMRPTKNKGGSE
jgi:adenylyl- and sulfurtransferase ThiI